MKHTTKETVMIRCDNPEKNKIGIFKYIERVIYPYGNMHVIKWRGYKWYVHFNGWNNGRPIYELGGLV